MDSLSSRRGCRAAPNEPNVGHAQWPTPTSGKLRRFVTWTSKKHKKAPKAFVVTSENEKLSDHDIDLSLVNKSWIAQWLKRNNVRHKPVARYELSVSYPYEDIVVGSPTLSNSSTDDRTTDAVEQWRSTDRVVTSPAFSTWTDRTLVDDSPQSVSISIIKHMQAVDRQNLQENIARSPELSPTICAQYWNQCDLVVGMQALELSADSASHDFADHNAKYLLIETTESKSALDCSTRCPSSSASPVIDDDRADVSSHNSTRSEIDDSGLYSSDSSLFDGVDAMQLDILSDADVLLVPLLRDQIRDITAWQASDGFRTHVSSSRSSGTNQLPSRSSGASYTSDRYSAGNPRGKKRKGTYGDDGEDDNDDEQEENDQSGRQVPPALKRTSRKLACQFQKSNPAKYRAGSENGKKYKTCTRGFNDTKDLLDHLKGVHGGPKFFCERCSNIFKTSAEVAQHLKQPVPCEIFEDPEFLQEKYIMTSERKKALKRKSPKVSVEQHWYNVWNILFPGQDQPSSIFQDLFGLEEAYDRAVEELVPPFVQERMTGCNWRDSEEEEDYLRRFVQALRDRLWEVFEEERPRSDRSSGSLQSVGHPNGWSAELIQEEFNPAEGLSEMTVTMSMPQNAVDDVRLNKRSSDTHLVMLDQGPSNHGLVNSTLIPFQSPTLPPFRDSGYSDAPEMSIPIHLFGSRNTEQGVNPQDLSLNRTGWHGPPYLGANDGKF